MTRTHWKTLTVLLTMLTLLAVGCRSTTGQSVGQSIDDKTLLASVKSKLVADKASNLTRVHVDVNNGTVYLTGNVETAEQKARAERIANEVKGVRSVVNNLQIQKP